MITRISPPQLHDAWQRPFIPDRLTPLPFTPAWSALRPPERLRYNQLHGLYYHEQIIFFEQRLIVPLLCALQPTVSDLRMRAALDTFIDEENTHSAAFAALLRELQPKRYTGSWQHFVRSGPLASRLLAFMVRRPRLFPCLLWLMQLLEERTMFASRLYLAEADAFPPAVLALHRQHLSDEADHVQWDITLLDEIWAATPAWLRRINVRLLNWMLGEFIAVPRRAAFRVVDALAADMPDLSVPVTDLKAALCTLAATPEFRGAIFGRDAVPRTWKQASTAPDLTPFVDTWLAHDHAP